MGLDNQTETCRATNATKSIYVVQYVVQYGICVVLIMRLCERAMLFDFCDEGRSNVVMCE